MKKHTYKYGINMIMYDNQLLLSNDDYYKNPIGGTITEDGDFNIHTFTSSGDFIVYDLPIDASILILGQGGNGGAPYDSGGGSNGGGGGGASGEIKIFNYSFAAGTHEVNIGSWPGGSVTFATQTVSGGTNGADAFYVMFGRGGDGGSNSSYTGCDRSDHPSQNGGGGAGCNGSTIVTTGGSGLSSSITGSVITYGVGGNGGLSSPEPKPGSPGATGIVIIRYRNLNK